MPYMPTNLYPKNCAIQKKSDNLVNIDFLAKLDTNDKIIGYTVHLYAYGNSEPVYTISYNADDETNKHTIIGPENNITTIDISEFDNGFCITENNDFKLSCQNLLLEQLKYKAIWNNKRLYQIDTYYPSSQICSNCKTKNKNLKDLSIRNWECQNCHTMHDRDINASFNILDEGIKLYMKDLQKLKI